MSRCPSHSGLIHASASCWNGSDFRCESDRIAGSRSPAAASGTSGRRRSLPLYHRLHHQLDQPLRALVGRDLRPVPFDPRPSAELEGAAVLEIHHEQAGTRIGGEVAEGVEHHVARIVRDDQPVGRRHTHEPGRAAAMRHVGAGARVAARQEQGVGLGQSAHVLGGEARRRSGPAAERSRPNQGARPHAAGCTSGSWHTPRAS